MSVRNILDSIGGSPTVDFTYNHAQPLNFTGAGTFTTTAVFRRSNNLCVIAIDSIYIGTVATATTLNTTGFTLPPEMTPTGQAAYTNVFISNGANSLGRGFLVKGGGIGISGGPNYDDPFTVGSTNAGVPYGCLLVYSIE